MGKESRRRKQRARTAIRWEYTLTLSRDVMSTTQSCGAVKKHVCAWTPRLPTAIAWMVGSLLLAAVFQIGALEQLDLPSSRAYIRGSPTISHEQSRHLIWDAAVNRVLETEAEASVPNYLRVWWARNLIWSNPQVRGGYLNPFGWNLVTQRPGATSDARALMTVTPWRELCNIDSDADGFTNGQELGDPCCIFTGTLAKQLRHSDTGWSWLLSHPGAPESVPEIDARDLIRNMNCTEVAASGHYPDNSAQFDEFYFKDFKDFKHDVTNDLFRIAFLGIYLLIVVWWWREFSFASNSANDTGLSKLAALAVGALAYMHNDLTSAFVHEFFDSCNWDHPLIGAQCKGTQTHHQHPRSQSLEPLLHWFGNPIAVLPAVFVVLIYGFLGNKFTSFLPRGSMISRCCQTGFEFPRWFDFFIWCLALSAPCTYVFHQAAHTPESDRGALMRLMQWTQLSLGPQFHKEHHERPNMTWSVMVGWFDFVPHHMLSLAAYFNSRLPTAWRLEHAQWALIFIWILILLPWYVWLVYFSCFKRSKSKTN